MQNDFDEEENLNENPDLSMTAKFAPNPSTSRKIEDHSMALLGDQSNSYHIDMGQYVV